MGAYGMIRAFGMITLLAAVSVHCAKIHEQMSDEEIANVFHTTRDNIPEYDVVPVRHSLHKRSDPNLRLQFTAFGKQIDTYLQPSDSKLAGKNTPVWLVFTTPDGRIAHKKLRDDIVGIVASSYNSPIDLSTVVVNEADGKDNPSFQGIVDAMTVRPLPARLQDEAKRFKRNIEAFDANSTLLDSRYHVIIKSPSLKEEQKLRQLERQIRGATQSANKSDVSKVKRSMQEVVYPTILIRTDFKGSKTTQNDLAYHDEIMYQLAFWNAVDLRYRHVDNPKVRLRIAGIIIGQDRAATPYLNKHRHNDVIDITEAWSDVQQFWKDTSTTYADFVPRAYDAIVTMTNYDMTATENGVKAPILGIAAKRSLCYTGDSESYYAIAVIRDRGGFDGILTATHEFGHILGLNHDTNSGDECDKSLGFIMAPVYVVTLKNLEWSPCSLKDLSYFLRESNIYCADQPAEYHRPGPSVTRFLPGDILDAHKQCQSRGYAWACDPYPEMCTHMNCYHTGWKGFTRGWWCQNSGPAAEGTACATGHKCVDGVCQCLTEDCIYEKQEKTV